MLDNSALMRSFKCFSSDEWASLSPALNVMHCFYIAAFPIQIDGNCVGCSMKKIGPVTSQR